MIENSLWLFEIEMLKVFRGLCAGGFFGEVGYTKIIETRSCD